MKKSSLINKIFFLSSICLILVTNVQAEHIGLSECGGTSCNDYLDDVSCNVNIGNKSIIQNPDAGCGVDVPLSCADYLDTVKIKFDIDTEDGVIFEKYVNKDNNSEIGYRSCTDECAITFAGKCKYEPPCYKDPKFDEIGDECFAVNDQCGEKNIGKYECVDNKVVCNAEKPECLDPCTNFTAPKENDLDESDGKVSATLYTCVKTDAQNPLYGTYNVGNYNYLVTSSGKYIDAEYQDTIREIIKGVKTTADLNVKLNVYNGNISAAQNAYKSGNYCYVCGYIRSSGCFAPDTKISLADGSVKQAKDVNTGDVLFNPVTRKGVTVEKVIEGPEAAELVLIEYAGGSLKVSQEHPVLTKQGLIQAKDLKAGDTIFNGDNNEFEVASVKTLPVEEGQYVINFVVKSDGDIKDYKNRMLLSEGVITGDLTTQIELKLSK